jgi:Protein of unknown function (DUF3489)
LELGDFDRATFDDLRHGHWEIEMPIGKPSSKSNKLKAVRTGRHTSSQVPIKKTKLAGIAPVLRKPSEVGVSKQSRVIAMLRQPAGTSIAAIMAATGWQEHSVRGFFAAVIKKRFGLLLVSQKTDSGRVYRIESTDSVSRD